MEARRTALIIPVENQVRELDAKLLLGCVAVERGLSVIIGSRTRVDFRIASLPRGIYVSKSLTPRSIKMFGILRNLGHEIVAWDEESLVHHSPDHYFARRLSPTTLRQLSMLLAWGPDNADLLRKYPDYPGTPIHVTGNPRGDLLRPELRPYFEDGAERIRQRYGRFVLVNTNYAMVNAFLPTHNLLRPSSTPGEAPLLGAPAAGLTRPFVEGFAAHKGALFDAFRRLLPTLDEAFPDHTIVLRPHPGENREPWQEISKACRNVRVVHEGNIIPWLMACRALIHNGCTTGVEAFAMKVPAISYRPVTSSRFDLELPNRLSHECFDVEQLREMLQKILGGQLGSADSADRRELSGHFLSAQEGQLASDRILDVLLQGDAARRGLPRPGLGKFVRGWVAATQRHFVKRIIKARVSGHRNSPAFQSHRFGGVSVAELQARIRRLGEPLGRFQGVRVQPIAEHVFRLDG